MMEQLIDLYPIVLGAGIFTVILILVITVVRDWFFGGKK